MVDLALSPAGRLLLQENEAASAFSLPATLEQSLRKASEKGPAEILLQLALCHGEAGLSPVLAYWRRFGERYLTELCHVPETTEDLREPLSPPGEWFDSPSDRPHVVMLLIFRICHLGSPEIFPSDCLSFLPLPGFSAPTATVR